MKNKFTIILPVHNGSNYVKECVNSILGQKYKFFNLEILENCSTDGTSEWLSTLKDKRIRIWPSERLLTIEENWKRILSVPKNEFMTIIGHDDILYPDYLSTIQQLINKHPDANLYQTHFDIIDSTGSIIRECRPIPPVEKLGHFLALRMSHAEDSFGTGYMLRSNDYKKVGGIPAYRKLLFADDSLWLKIIDNGFKVTSEKKNFAYRLHSQSTSHTRDGKDFFYSLYEYISFLKTINNDHVKTILDKNIRNYINHYCPNYIDKIKLIIFYSNENLSLWGKIKRALKIVLLP